MTYKKMLVLLAEAKDAGSEENDMLMEVAIKSYQAWLTSKGLSGNIPDEEYDALLSAYLEGLELLPKATAA